MVHLALDGRLGEHLGGLLEGGGGQERLGGQRRLSDAQQQPGAGGQNQLLAVLPGFPGLGALPDGGAGVAEFDNVNGGAGQQAGIAGVLHPHLAHHLPDDDLDVLVVDIHALLAVGLLDLLDQVVVHRVHAPDAQHLMGGQRALGEPLALLGLVAGLYPDAGAVGQGIGDHLAVVGGDGDIAQGSPLGFFHGDYAGDFGQLGHLLGLAGLQQLLYAGKALGDIAAGHAAGVEGTHGQLGARLTDGLGGDDAHRLALAHGLAEGQVHAVALGAYAGVGLAGEHGAHPDGHPALRVALGLCLGAKLGFDTLGQLAVHQGIPAGQHPAGLKVGHVLGQIAAPQALFQGLDDLPVLVDLGHGDAVVGQAVLLADDDLLGHVHQAAGEVAGVGGTQGGVRHALSGAPGGDEVLQNRQAFAEIGFDGDLNGAPGGVGHQAAHTGQLADLGLGTTGAGIRHHEDGVVAVHGRLEGVGHVGGSLFPGGHHQAVALVIGEEAALVLVLDLDDFLLGGGDKLPLLIGDGHIGDGHGEGALGGELVTPGLDGVQHLGGAGKAVLGDTAVHNLAQLLLAAHEVDLRLEDLLGVGAVHEIQILRNALVKEQAAHGGAHQLMAHLTADFRKAADQDGLVELQDALGVGQLGLVVVGEYAVDLFCLPVLGLGAQGGGGAVPAVCLSVPDPHPVVLGHRAVGQRLGGVGGGLIGEVGVVGGVALIGQVVGAQHHILGGHGDRPAIGGLEQVVGGQHEDAGFSLGLGGQGDVDGHLVAVEVGVEGGAHQGVELHGPALHQDRLEGLDAQAVEGGGAVEHDGVLLDDGFQSVPHGGGALVHFLFGGLDVADAALHQLLHDEGPEQLNGHLLGHAALVDLQLGAHHDDGAPGVVHTLTQQVLAEAALLALEQVGQGFEGTVIGPGDGAAPAAVVDEGVHRLLEHPFLVAHDDIRRVELDEPLQAVVAVDDPAVQVVQVGGGKPAAVQLHHGAQLGGDDRQNVDNHPLRLVAGHAEGVHHLQALDQLGLFLAAGVLHLGAQGGGKLLQVQIGQQLLDGLRAHAGVKVVLVILPQLLVLRVGENLVAGQVGVVGAGIGDDIGGEVQHLFQNPGADIQQQPHPGGDALEIPDMAHRGGQLNVAHALPAHFGPGDLHAAAVAHLALEADLLILAAVAFPILGGAEDALTEQPVPFGLEGAVVDGLRLFHLAVGPVSDLLRGGDTDADGIEFSVAHCFTLPSQSSPSKRSSSPASASAPTAKSSSSLVSFMVKPASANSLSLPTS